MINFAAPKNDSALQAYNSAINAIKNARAEESAAADFPWDITTPEGIIAFFGDRMKSTDADLRSLMVKQQNRNTIISQIKALNAILTSGKEIRPGSDDWAEFQRLAQIVGPSLGATDDAKAIASTLKSALGEHVEDTFLRDNEAGQAEFRAAHPNTTVAADPDDGDRVILSEGGGLSVDAAKVLADKLVAQSDNFSSDNQLDGIRVQQMVGQISQITSLASNLVQKLNETAMVSIQNVRNG